MTPETLLSLADRVCAGDGPDRELDGDISELFNPDNWKPEYIRGQAWCYSSSLDAVERLRARMLPGSEMTVNHHELGFDVTISPAGWPSDGDAFGNAPTEPRARLAAILRALAAGG